MTTTVSSPLPMVIMTRRVSMRIVMDGIASLLSGHLLAQVAFRIGFQA